MKAKVLIAIICVLSLVPGFAQAQKNRRQTSKKPKIVKTNPPAAAPMTDEEKRQREELERMDKEAAYYAPVRYAIVYNWIFDELSLPERRMDILMDARQLNEKNLIKVFELIKQRFPTPLRLMIDVHTSLATIETPEENEMLKDSDDSRFGHIRFKYKRAFYMRFENGREGFSYSTSLSPFYKEKNVVLKDIKIQ